MFFIGKSIICSASCNKYVAHRFIAVALNWIINPSSLCHGNIQIVEEIITFVGKNIEDWNDQTSELLRNEYFKNFGCNNMNIKFALDCIIISNNWNNSIESLHKWLLNLKNSNKKEVQFQLHTFLFGIVLCENNKNIIQISLDILFDIMSYYKDISFSLLCLLFHKLVKESHPIMQKKYLFCLPSLAVQKVSE